MESFKGLFSTSVYCFQLQAKALFDDVGGDKALQLLDAISQLDELDREILLKSFTNIVHRLRKDEANTSHTQSPSDLEEQIYFEIAEALKLKTSKSLGIRAEKPHGLRLLSGGKNQLASA